MSEASNETIVKAAAKYVVRMLADKQGVDAGEIHPKLFRKGEEYEIGESLYSGFKSMGVIELVQAPEGGDRTITKEKDTRPGAERITPAELRKQAKAAGIKFDKNTSDEQLAELIKAHATEGDKNNAE